MGQGYSLITLSAGSAGIDVPELSDLEYEKMLGTPRLIKTVRARHKDGLVVAKVFMKPYSSMKLEDYVRKLISERRTLADVPNALPYHRILETATNGFLVRQYIHSSLYDRISTNPSLEDIEKKWISFQLLCAVRDCHTRNIYHGDIKTENVLVTTWNWVYLTDFSSSYKPTTLPEDNPATFSIFFDASGQRKCYVAPERFVGTSQQAEGLESATLNWAMDIFSVGCVIAELFTEAPIFNLSQLFRYRKGEYDPKHASLNKIKDESIREMVAHMIQLDPESRYSAEDYLAFWRDKAFPGYFSDFMHQYVSLVTDPTSGRQPVSAGTSNLGESDDRIDRVYNDFDKISFFLGFNDIERSSEAQKRPASSFGLDLYPLEVDIPNNRHMAKNSGDQSQNNGALLFLNVVTSSLRTTARSSARVRGCELLLAFGETLTDDAKLDRVLPYALALLEDKVETVQIAALRAVTQLLELVQMLSPMNAFIFPRYVLPRLQRFITTEAFSKSSPLRATYAACLASLATTASRFLDMMQALRADGTLPSTDPEAEDDVTAYAEYQTLYDVTREDLVQQIETQTKLFLTDDDPAVRRAFLGSVPSLCVFFGDTLANDLILTHLNTYLNDDDWSLKCAFFETVVAVAAFVGGASLEDFILPLMIQALSDPEETVTEEVIRSLSNMAHLGLFQRHVLLELVVIIVPFSLHPNSWIREAAAQFVSSTITHLSEADARSLVLPLVKPVLKMASADFSELSLLDALRKPISRPVLEMAKTWAVNADKGTFWKPAQQVRIQSFASGRSAIEAYREISSSRTNKNEEDEQWLSRMRNIGMKPEDESKLLALGVYIWRNTLRTGKAGPQTRLSRYDHVVSLSAEGVSLQNVLFDEDLRYYEQLTSKANEEHISEKPRAKGRAIEDDAARSNQERVDRPRILTGIQPGSLMPIISTPKQETGSSPMEIKQEDPSRKANLLGNVDENVSSSPNSILSISSRNHNHAIRHKGSAMNLLKANERSNKATAEISTDSATAVGRVDMPVEASRRGTPQTTSQPQRHPTARVQGAHSYNGRDPNVLKLLDSMYTSNYPVDIAEFGPVVPVRRGPISSPGSQASAGLWRPSGQLVAVMGEHSARINCLAVAPDHTFFVTGSDDGTVRIWDTSRLERNIAHRSRLVHKHAPGVRITGICFVEATHCFMSTGSDGSVNVVKVEVSEAGTSTRYGRLSVLRDWTIPTNSAGGEYVVAIEHFRSEGQSICMLATSLCRILAIDLRAMTVLYELSNPAQHGTPTSLLIHRRRQWLLLGTSHGVLDLWDLRFRLRLRAWTFRNAVPVYQLSPHPNRRGSSRQRVVIAGGTASGHVSVWDLDKLSCLELYHVAADTSEKVSARNLELVNLDDEKNESSLSRVAGEERADGRVNGTAAGDGAVRSFAMGMHVQDESSDPKHSYLITSGPDWRVRFWDTDRINYSTIVNGVGSGSQASPLSSTPSGENEKPTYSATIVGTDTRVFTERAAATPSDKPEPGRSARPSPAKRSTTTGGIKVARYDVIRGSAQSLLRCHRDAITCVAVLERPFGMVVSADREGLIYVFQ